MPELPVNIEIRLRCVEAAVQINRGVPVHVVDILNRAEVLEEYVKTGAKPGR